MSQNNPVNLKEIKALPLLDYYFIVNKKIEENKPKPNG